MKGRDNTQHHEADDELLTPAEVAQKLRVDIAWVYKAVETKRLAIIRIGRYIRIEASALRRYLDQRREG
jgi:excisionase family DNA binding protein